MAATVSVAVLALASALLQLIARVTSTQKKLGSASYYGRIKKVTCKRGTSLGSRDAIARSRE